MGRALRGQNTILVLILFSIFLWNHNVAEGASDFRFCKVLAIVASPIKRVVRLLRPKSIAKGREENAARPVSKPLTKGDIEVMQAAAYSKAKSEGNDINTDIFANPIEMEVGRHFDAHGISKLTIAQHVVQLINLLENGLHEGAFHTAPLEMRVGVDGFSVHKDGSFVLLSDVDGQLVTKGQTKLHIKYVIVNDAYYDAVPRLNEAYPEVHFIRATDAPSVLAEAVRSKGPSPER